MSYRFVINSTALVANCLMQVLAVDLKKESK